VDTLAAHVGSAGMLLTLDTCDHLIDEVATAVARLLRRCPGLRVLVTSRERLGVTGETVRPLSGLGLPEPGAVGADAIGRADAVRFLVDRLNAVRPGVELTDATAELVARICRRLDGLPLALELAAPAIQAWGLEEVAARLDDRFRLLTHGSRSAPARHQSLHAMVDWSVRRLDPVQRRMFDRLAGLRDGFTLGDVEVAWDGSAAAGRTAVSVLAQLVDKSLVCVLHTDAGETRYRLLETLRAYAVERAEPSAAARVRRRISRPEGRTHTVRSRSTVAAAGAMPIPEGR
jgi:predicted ATPase